MPHCTSDMRDQDDEINHKGISRRDEVVVGFYLRRILRRDKIAIAGSSFRISRGGFSPGKPRCRKQLSHLPTLAWRGSPQGGFSPGKHLDAGSSFRICRPLPGEDLPGRILPRETPRCREAFTLADPCLERISPGRILPRETLDAGSSFRICRPLPGEDLPREDSPQGNPRCRKQLSHLPTLAWRGSSQGGFSPVTLDAGSLSQLPTLAWGGFSPGQTSRLDLPSCVQAVFVPLIASLPAAC